MPDQSLEDNNKSDDRKPRTEDVNQLSVLLQKVVGSDNTPQLTESQVDEVLLQRRQVNELISQDRQRDSYDSKFFLVSTSVFILAFSGLVLWLKPDLLSEVLALLIGGAGGYGFGRSKNNSSPLGS